MQDLWGTGKLDMLVLVEPRSQLRTLQEQSKPVWGRDWGPCLGLDPPGMGWVQMIVTMQVFPTWCLRGFGPFESWKIGERRMRRSVVGKRKRRSERGEFWESPGSVDTVFPGSRMPPIAALGLGTSHPSQGAGGMDKLEAWMLHEAPVLAWP